MISASRTCLLRLMTEKVTRWSGIEFPDHLQHQQLVKIGIEQAAHDRVEPPAVIVGPGCDVCNCHGAILSRRRPCNQWLSASGMAGQRGIRCLDTADHGRVQAGPGRLSGGELPPQVGDQLGELVVGQAVLEARHISEIARNRRGDAVQDHLDQIVGHGSVQIAVQRQRRPAAEQGRRRRPMANGAGAFIETRADAEAGSGPGAGEVSSLRPAHPGPVC